MTLLFYIFEIQNRLIIVIFGTLISTGISYYYKKTLIYLIIKPILVYSLKYQYIYFIYTNLPEIFITYFFIIIFYSIHFFIFFLILHVYLFLLPGLYLSEKKKLYTYIINTISFWLFFYFILFITIPINLGIFFYYNIK